jgi:hypothetical protein
VPEVPNTRRVLSPLLYVPRKPDHLRWSNPENPGRQVQADLLMNREPSDPSPLRLGSSSCLGTSRHRSRPPAEVDKPQAMSVRSGHSRFSNRSVPSSGEASYTITTTVGPSQSRLRSQAKADVQSQALFVRPGHSRLSNRSAPSSGEGNYTITTTVGLSRSRLRSQAKVDVHLRAIFVRPGHSRFSNRSAPSSGEANYMITTMVGPSQSRLRPQAKVDVQSQASPSTRPTSQASPSTRPTCQHRPSARTEQKQDYPPEQTASRSARGIATNQRD